MKYFPIALRLESDPVLVIGGGIVAQRKVLSLLRAGANILVVAPALTVKLNKLCRDKRVSLRRRKVVRSDLRGKKMVISATSDAKVNSAVGKWAKEYGLLVNVVDQPNLSNFISTAIIRKGKLLISVYSDGKDPRLSRDVKNYLKENWDAFLSNRPRL